MKIAFFLSQAIIKHYGGCEKYFITLTKYLSSIKDFHADIITMDDDFSYAINRLLSFYYLKKRDKKNVRASINSIKKNAGRGNYYKCKNISELKNKLKQYDLIYTKNEILELFYLKILIGYKNLPHIIVGFHTPYIHPISKSHYSKIHNIVYKSVFYKLLLKGTKTFHVINELNYQLLKKQFPRHTIVNIPHPFLLTEFVALKNKYSFPLKKMSNTINIAWIGRLTEQKGVKDLVSIIKSVNKTLNNKIRWNISGDGDKKEKDLVKEVVSKNNNVNYYGFINNKYIASFLSKNDIFISTSHWESSPFNIIEAQATKLPVISYDIAGPSDILINNKTGFLVKNEKDFVSKLMFLINNINYFKKRDIIANIMNKYDLKRTYEQLLLMFKESI